MKYLTGAVGAIEKRISNVEEKLNIGLSATSIIEPVRNELSDVPAIFIANVSPLDHHNVCLQQGSDEISVIDLEGSDLPCQKRVCVSKNPPHTILVPQIHEFPATPNVLKIKSKSHIGKEVKKSRKEQKKNVSKIH